MARLLDDIRGGARIQMPWVIAPELESDWQRHTRGVVDLLGPAPETLPVLVIDNVAEYLYSGTDQERWDIGRDFPNLAPPFDGFWVEHRLPTRIHSKECGDSDVRDLVPHGRLGALVMALDPKTQCQGEGVPENTRWVLWLELFIDYGLDRDVTVQGSHGAIFLAIDGEGRALGNPWMQTFTAGRHEDDVKNIMTFINPALLAISFLHCKNVEMVDNPVPPKLAKRYRERHAGLQPSGFKTLIIEPLKQILRRQGRSGEVGLAKALHICRGHFKDYREGRGLFGKYHQLVWQPALVRGTRGQSAPPREIEVKV